jgi:hypothetical protein
MSNEDNRAEEALTSRDQELRLLVEAIPVLVWRAGPEGNIEYVNKLKWPRAAGPFLSAVKLEGRLLVVLYQDAKGSLSC